MLGRTKKLPEKLQQAHRVSGPGMPHCCARNENYPHVAGSLRDDCMTLWCCVGLTSSLKVDIFPYGHPETWHRTRSSKSHITVIDVGQTSSHVWKLRGEDGTVQLRDKYKARLTVLGTIVYCTVDAPDDAETPQFRMEVDSLGDTFA